MNKLELLLHSGKTIVSIQDLAIIWNIPEKRQLAEVIKYYIRKGKLIPLRRGLYATGSNYGKLEVAQKIIPLSYISLQSALSIHGIVFQYYTNVSCVALQTKHVTIKENLFSYHKIKKDIFFSSTGILQEKHYTIASPERAVCDTLYFYPHFTFDNLSVLRPGVLTETSDIYHNSQLSKRIALLINTFPHA